VITTAFNQELLCGRKANGGNYFLWDDYPAIRIKFKFKSGRVKCFNFIKIADGLESRGELVHPVRYALSGKDQSPDPFIIASIIGKNETLSRLQKAI